MIAPEFFDRIARRYDRTFAPDAASTGADLRALLSGASGVALDLGCGTGRAFPHLLEAGLSVIALDASLPMLAEAAKRSSAAEVALVRADFWARWPIADGSIDVVLALHSVLAHPPHDPESDWAHVGREILRVAKPGALVAIDIPDPEFAARSMRSLGGDRYAFEDPSAEVEAVIPDPARVLAALALPLSLVIGPQGPRAVGRLTRRS
ncbi:MAG: class I SAM-dependent methyltransferase [Polyangiales bacterium]